MGFKENGPGCCDCGDPAECDGLTCSWTQSWDSVQGEITYYWTVTATSNTHKINSILVDGVQQLASGEEVYTKSGSIGPYARGSAVPASVVLSATNTCGNTCTNTLEPDCCVRTTVSYTEISGFLSLYEASCSSSFTDSFGVTTTSNTYEKWTGADGLNGTWSEAFLSNAQIEPQPPFYRPNECWGYDYPLAITGVAGEWYGESSVTTSDNSYFRSGYSRETGYWEVAGFDLNFHSNVGEIYENENGSVWSDNNLPPIDIPHGKLLSDLDCLTPGSFGPAAGVVDNFYNCWDRYPPTVPSTCSGYDGNTGGRAGCYWNGGSARRWIGN